MGSGERCAQAGCKLLARQHRPKLLASKGDLQRYMAVTYETEAQKQALHDEIDDSLSRVSTMVGMTDPEHPRLIVFKCAREIEDHFKCD